MGWDLSDSQRLRVSALEESTPRRQGAEAQGDVPDGFRDTPLGPLPVEWEVVRLGELVQQAFSGGTPSTKKPEYWNGDIPWITSAYIDGLYVTQGARRITEIGLSNSSSKLVPKDNLLIGSRVGVGKVAINKIDVAISQDLTGLIIETSQADLEFLAFTISSPQVQNFFVHSTRGTTIKGIPREDLLQIPIPLPPLPEQRAIAHVLRTVQQAREATERVIAAARELKRALMRHLFTYGPVSIAQADQVALRETEVGPVPVEWDVVLLGEIQTATQYGLSMRGEGEGQYPILRMNNLLDGRIDTSGLQYVNLSESDFQKFRLHKGDILFNRTNSYELVGKTALFDLNDDFVFASYLIRVMVNPAYCVPAFFNYYLNFEATQARLKMLASRGVSQSNISASKLRGFAVPLPSMEEQREIARILSAVDARIAAEEARREALDALFHTLLHHLMTGKIRTQGRQDAKRQRTET
ncbi:MAG TPA: restriction endonuclease subunit S [Anaerolineae bacterium]|nr:restriction endonuclease subunit S [Anaerolineae bacterium]